MSICCSTERSTTPRTLAMTLRTCSASERSLYRSSPKILTAMLARVPESMWSMRCEIGWPMVMFIPGTSEKSLRSSAEESSLGASRRQLKRYVQFGGLDTLRVLVQFRPAGAAGDAGNFRMGEQHALDDSAQFVRLLKRRARQGDGADRQRAFVEFRQEAAAHEWNGGQQPR